MKLLQYLFQKMKDDRMFLENACCNNCVIFLNHYRIIVMYYFVKKYAKIK